MRDRAHPHTTGQFGERLTDEAGTSSRFNPPLLTKPAQPIRDAVTYASAILDRLARHPRAAEGLRRRRCGPQGGRGGQHPGQRDYVAAARQLPRGSAAPAGEGGAAVGGAGRGLWRHHRHCGQQVYGQRRIQSVSDPFLGWTTRGYRPFFVRQLRDMKDFIDPKRLRGGGPRLHGDLSGPSWPRRTPAPGTRR